VPYKRNNAYYKNIALNGAAQRANIKKPISKIPERFRRQSPVSNNLACKGNSFSISNYRKRGGAAKKILPNLTALNQTLLREDSESSVKLIESIIEKHGYSLFLLRKIAYLQSLETGDGELSRKIKNIVADKFQHHVLAVFMATYEMLDPDDDEWQVRLRWIDIFENSNSWWQEFVESLFWPYADFSKSASSKILTHCLAPKFCAIPD
jgi:hypothetical protein